MVRNNHWSRLLVVAAIVGSAGCKSESKPSGEQQQLQESKIAIQRVKLEQMAFEAFARWASKNPERACPASLDEVTAFLPVRDTTDVWGRPLVMLCGSDLPPEVKVGFGVLSLGPDGKRDTDDDVTSWK